MGLGCFFLVDLCISGSSLSDSDGLFLFSMFLYLSNRRYFFFLGGFSEAADFEWLSLCLHTLKHVVCDVMYYFAD